MIERDLCSGKSIDERSGAATWTMNLILGSKKQQTSWYEGGFLFGKNKRNKMESPPKQETNSREVADMMKDKVIKRSKWCQKMLNLPAQMRDEKDERMMRNEKMNVVETPRIKYPRQWHQKMLSHRLSQQPSDRGLWLWSPISPFKPSPEAKGVRPYGMKEDQLWTSWVGRHNKAIPKLDWF